jgi:hypothetical protein
MDVSRGGRNTVQPPPGLAPHLIHGMQGVAEMRRSARQRRAGTP